MQRRSADELELIIGRPDARANISNLPSFGEGCAGREMRAVQQIEVGYKFGVIVARHKGGAGWWYRDLSSGCQRCSDLIGRRASGICFCRSIRAGGQ